MTMSNETVNEVIAIAKTAHAHLQDRATWETIADGATTERLDNGILLIEFEDDFAGVSNIASVSGSNGKYVVSLGVGDADIVVADEPGEPDRQALLDAIVSDPIRATRYALEVIETELCRLSKLTPLTNEEAGRDAYYRAQLEAVEAEFAQ